MGQDVTEGDGAKEGPERAEVAAAWKDVGAGCERGTEPLMKSTESH